MEEFKGISFFKRMAYSAKIQKLLVCVFEGTMYSFLSLFMWFIIFYVVQLLVFSVTPFKIDQNKNQNRSIDKVQNLGNERR